MTSGPSFDLSGLHPPRDPRPEPRPYEPPEYPTIFLGGSLHGQTIPIGLDDHYRTVHKTREVYQKITVTRNGGRELVPIMLLDGMSDEERQKALRCILP